MIKPMNAKSAGSKLDKLLDDPKYVAECKIDGYRAICENGVFTSRLGNDLSAKVPHLTQILKEYNVTLDGELCLGGTTNSSDVTKILGSLPEKAVARQEELGKLRYVVFDVLAVDGEDLTLLPWKERRKELDIFFDVFVDDYKYINKSEYRTDKHSMLRYTESHGLEGIMLKNIDSLYYPDKRPENTWYKVKKSMTYDVVVMGYTDGRGKYEGLIGAVEFGLYKEGTLTYCGQCSGFDDEMRRNITGSKEFYMHRVFEISAMERTPDGHFRHPVFRQWRSDKAPMQCLWKQ